MSLERDVVNLDDDRILVRRDNLKLLKQRNIFCNIAKRLYSHLKELYYSSNILKDLRCKLLHFLEFKENID